MSATTSLLPRLLAGFLGLPASTGASRSHRSARRPHRPRRPLPRSAAALAAALLCAGLLLPAPAHAWDSIYGNYFGLSGPSVEWVSKGVWQVTEGGTITVTFGKFNNVLKDGNMNFSTEAFPANGFFDGNPGAAAHTDFQIVSPTTSSFPGNHYPRKFTHTISTYDNTKVDGKRCFFVKVNWDGKVHLPSWIGWMMWVDKRGSQTHVVCILDDDKDRQPPGLTLPQTAGVSVSNASVEEGGAMTFRVSTALAVGGAFRVQPAITHSSTESGDFSFTAPELSFAGTGAETKTFTVQTTEDTDIEGPESFDVALTLVAKPKSGTLSLGTGRGTILDDDYPELTISDASVVEGGRLDFTLTLDDAIPPGYSAFYVQPAITAGTATANSDYVAATPSLVRFAGTKGEKKTVRVTTLADTVRNEPDETLTLSASGVSSAPVVTTDTGTGTIKERTYSDANRPALSISGGGNVNEGSSVSWTVTLDKATSGPFTVTPDFTGTATKVTDYKVTAGKRLSYAGTANEAKTVTIEALKDGTSEGDETVLLGLDATPSGRVDDSATGSATIKNVDPPDKKDQVWTVKITMGDVTVTEGGTAEVDVDVRAERESYGNCNTLVAFYGEAKILGGTATSGSDYNATVNWKGKGTKIKLSCMRNGTVTSTLEIRTTDDSLLEGKETIKIGLTTTPYHKTDNKKWKDFMKSLGTGVEAVVTIDDNDSAGLSASDVTVDEGDTASVTVTATGVAVEGGYTLTPKLAIPNSYKNRTQAGRDYDDNPASLTFAGTVSETEPLSVDTYADGVVTEAKQVCASFTSDHDAVSTSGATPCITISNTDKVTLEVADAEVDEDDGTVAVTVTSKKKVDGKFEVRIEHDGTGTASTADYTIDTSVYQEFAGTAGETKTYTVTIKDDTITEGLETFGVRARLRWGDVSTIYGSSQDTDDKWNGTVSIIDDDNDWLSVSDPTVEEGGDLVFKVKLEKARSPAPTLKARVVKIPGGAGSGDYTDTTATLTFAGTKGEEKSFTVATTEDTEIEADEALAAVVSESGANKPDLAAGTGTITDDDEANVTVRVKRKKTAGASAQGAGAQGGLVMAAARAEVRERGWATAAQQAQAAKSGKVYEGHDLVYEAVLDKAVPGGFTFTPNLGGGSATSGDDYGNTTGKLQFTGSADETLEFTVSAYKDSTVEGDEDYGVAAAVSATPHTVNVSKKFNSEILDADGADVTAQDVSAAEGDTLTFTVRLNKKVAGGLTVTPSYKNVKSCATGALCKKAASGDYTANTAAFSFTGNKGEEKSFTVATTENTAVDLDRTFQVSLNISNNVGEVSGGAAIATITNDDKAAVTVNDASASEGDAMTFTVTLDKAVENGLTVTPSYANGTAASGDYTANTTALTFTGTANETETFTVSTTEDAVLEANETFTVGLTVSDAPALVTGTDTGTGTINNDDAAAVTVGDASASEGDSKTFAVTLDKAVQGGLTVTPSFTDVTAVNGTDYTPITAPLTFTGTAGETQTLTINTTEDAVLEADETLTVGLTVSGTTLSVTATDTGTFTIDDDDAAAVTVDDQSADEGNSITFTVTLDKAVQDGLTVTPSYANGTAASTDYTENTTALSFTGTAGETQTFTVATTEDAVLEADETFTVSLAVSNQPTGATVTATDTGTGTIDNDDGTTVTVNDAKADEGDDITFTVTLSEAVQGGLTVTPGFTDVTAVEGTDYDENTTALSFTGTKGETQTFTVATTEDAVVEADETFTVSLTASNAPADATVTATDTGTGTIDNDDAASLTVAGSGVSDASADEGDSMTFKVSLSAAVQGGLTVTPTYTNGTASDTDYTKNTTALSFTGTKDEEKTFTVATTEDAVLEADETFTVGLSVTPGTAGTTVTATDTGTGTIENDDSAAVTVDDADADEGDSMTFTVTLSEAVQGGLTVTPGYANGTAESGDYTANTTALSFAGTKGETETFTVATVEDAVVEADETFTVGLTVSKAPSGVTSTDTGSGTVNDDDASAVTLAAASADEGETITFTATLSEAVEGGVTATPSFTDKTAVEGTDYAKNTTALSFTGTKGETQTFDVSTTEDVVLEGDEAFTVALAVSGAPAGVTASGADGTIEDDDGAQVKVNDAEADEGNAMTFTVTLSAAVQGGLTVTPSFTDVSATKGTDYTENTTALSFTGTAGESKTFTVATTEDAAVEGNETFTVGLTVSGTTLAVGSADTGTGTVKDDDAAELTVDDRSKDEGDSMTFTVTLSKAVQGGLTVTPSYTNGTAASGDYTENTTALSFTGTKDETQTFTVATTEDAVLEADETFTVGLTVSGAPTGVTATDTGTGTIEDDDDAAVTVADAKADEGDAITFTVTLDKAVQGGLTVTPDYTNGTAASGDYTENTAAVTFTGTAGETQTFTVATTEDAVLEADETFTVGLTASNAPTGTTVTATDTGTGTIEDDDDAAVTVADAKASEGDSITFTVTLSAAVQGGLEVTPSFTDVSAVEGTDYDENTAALTFTGTKGETKTFTVSTTEDAIREADETFTVGLSASDAPAGTTVTATDTATGTIEDDDRAAVTVADAKANEGESITFTVTLDKAVQGGLTVTPGFTDVTAVEGTDYDENTTALSFTGTAGETKSFTVSTTEDAVLEADETFTVGLTASVALVTDSDTATGTVEDDDDAAVTVNDASAAEGDSITFTVTLSEAVQGGLTVTPGYTNVTAASGDYTANTTALSFTGTKGETKTFTVATTEDAVLEADETFTVGLAASNAPTGTTVTATDTGTGTITDDDSAAVTVDDASADEGDSITFTVTLSAAVQGGLKVTPSFTDGTAVEGTDYDENTAALSFTGTSGETKTFTVSTTEDAVVEGDETFTVALAVSATTLTVTATDTATGTVEDDDAAAVTIEDVSASEGDSMTFTVTLDKAVQGGLTVTPGFTDVTADEGTDYDENTTALSFTGTAGETKTFTVSTTEDAVVEGDETFTVALTASNALVTDADIASGTIVDDDDVTVTVDDQRADEGDSMTFTVTLDKAVQGGLTVTPSFTDVTATEGTDYDENTTALSFTGTANETQTFTVSTTEDAVVEGDETFTVGLTVSGAPTGTTVTATDVGTGTIEDDDSAELTVADASADEGDSITFTVTLSAAVQGGLTVAPSFTDVTTDKSTDYTENTAALSFAGTKDESKTFTVATIEDTVVEEDETFTVGLTASNALVTDSDTATGTITNDDHADLTLTANPASVAENAGAAQVTVTAATGGVTFPTEQAVTVKVGATGDSAESVKDYAAVSDFTISIGTGKSSGKGTFTLTPVDDNLMEGDEQISVAGTSAKIGAQRIEVTLTDDDRSAGKLPEILLSASPSLVVEGDTPTTVTVTATVADGKAFQEAQNVTVTVGAAGDSAQPGEDYARVSGFIITIAAEQTSGSASFTLSTIDDTVIEPEELITVAGTAPDVEVRGTGVAIVDDDYTEITLSADPALVPESAGATTVTVTASTDGDTFANDRTVTVSIGADGDAAVAGSDYATVSGFTITIAAGQTGASESFTLTPIDDRVIEDDEALTVAGSSPGLVVHDTSVTIVDDDYTEITLSADPARVPEEAGATTVTVTASTDGDTFADDRTVTVSIGADGDAAVAGSDYQPVAGFTVTIAAGRTSGSSTFVLTPIDDQVIEGDETLTVAGSSPSLVVHDTTVTIVDDDYTEITLTANPARVPEDADPTTVTVTASTDGDTFADDRTVTVTIGADGDAAVAGSDYERVAGFTITIAAGRTSASETFILTPIDDTVVEGDETITVAGTSPGLVVHGTSVTIVDDDHTDLTLSADPARVPEEAGATTVTVTASTDGDTFAADRTVTVTIGATGDAAVAGSDYERVAGFTVTIAAGHTSGSETFTLTPIDDRVIEGDEPLTVAGSSPGLVVHGTTVTIVDDDYTEITLSADPARVSEDADPTTVTVTASTDGDTFTGDRTVTVSIGADADPAVAGSDYETVSGFSITIAAGQTSGSETFTLTPIDDHFMEGDETLTVAGTSPGLVVHGTAVTLAEDDHTEIAMTVDPPQWNEGDGPTTVTVTLTLTSQTVRFPYAKTVAVSVHESGVEPAVDFAPVASFTITIPAGARSASHEFTLTPENDTLVEIAELITVVGQSAAAGEAASIRSAVTEVVELAVAALQEEINVLTTASATAVAVDPAALVRESLAARAAAAGVLAAVVELSDDDAARISLAAAPALVDEDGGPRQVKVTATLQGAVFSIDRKIEVSLGVSGDGAKRGVDYRDVEPFVVTIPKGAGEGAAAFTLTPVNDQELEEDETITVAGTLNGAPVRPAQVTLRDDDGPAARERFGRLNERLLPELSRAWSESVLELARGCVAGPRTAADGGVQDLAGALHGSGEALNAGELSLAEALSGTALALPLATEGANGADEAGGGADDEAAAGSGERGWLTAWAKGDYRQVAGDGGGQVRWDGHLLGAHAGVDARLDHGYTGGVGVAWSEGTAEYTDQGGAQPIAGTYRSRLASVHPYLCWNGADGSNAWGTVGGGLGLIEIDDEVAGRHESDALAATVAAGGSLRLLTGPGLAAADATALNLRSDAWLTWHQVKGDGELIGAHEVLTYRARLALTGTHVFALGGGGALSPEAELGVRWDGGAGATGLGLELGGGLGFAEPSWGLTAQLRGRALLVHEQSELRDWGVSGLLRLGPGESGEGLSLTVQPAYGAAGGGVERLWAQGTAAPEAAEPLGAAAGASLTTEIGYGVAAAGSGVLTPYAGLDLTDAERSYRLGGRLAVATGLDLSLEGLRRETAAGDPLHQLALTAAVTW